MSRTESPNPLPDEPISALRTLANEIAARAASASRRLESREVPTAHIRSRGVKILLDGRRAPKH